jgi:hypothetical protein
MEGWRGWINSRIVGRIEDVGLWLVGFGAEEVEDGVGSLVEGEAGGVDGVGGDALVVGAAEVEAALGGGEVGEVGASGGGGVGGLLGAAVGEGLEGGGEVDDGGVGCLLEEEAVAELFRGAAAEGEDDVMLAEERGEGGGLEVAEVGFAALGEDLGDGAVVTGFYFVIEVEEAPAEAVSEERAGGGFAGAHEAGENDTNCAGGGLGARFKFGWHVKRGWKQRCCTHCRLSVGVLVGLGAKEKPQTLWAAAR